ncbi:hypothetical protein [[Clostridium] polysaccharolyticum]|uniref:Uncharacterized protein n=1 Tax=[Clostridium] polysaccharolyticum TaxID=29364 RepID=A0A1I0CYN0_9FIRM|nr:hypothetical protein [[Clostridium] polysaccharolyticum]SET24890.1 hypothetical protein SAMN04487772_11221 [[Clostridium] polysaccharolyticum]
MYRFLAFYIKYQKVFHVVLRILFAIFVADIVRLIKAGGETNRIVSEILIALVLALVGSVTRNDKEK